MANKDCKKEMAPLTVHVVDDDAGIRALLERWLTLENFQPCLFASGEEFFTAFDADPAAPSAVILDLNLPGTGGMEVLERIQSASPAVPVVVLTADDSVESVVNAMRLGAADYVGKPVERNKLVKALAHATEKGQLRRRVEELEREVREVREASGVAVPGIIGESAAMRRVFSQLKRLWNSDVSVLIHGESGTGKEVVARALHSEGPRSSRPGVAVNCAAIPESLLESELFGHERGAFTGAVGRRIGRFEEADGGTLFLDEIGELSLPVQAKLLRVLQEKHFERVGGQTRIRSDFRLISATNRNLAAEVKAGRFRQDLYFRIAVFELELPPLRERPDDIALLAAAFLQQNARTAGRDVDRITPEALAALERYSWPGNVRELQNAIQRAVVLAEGGEIRLRDLHARITGAEPQRGPSAVSGQEPARAAHTLTDFTRDLVVEALRRNHGNASAAIRDLDISRSRFYRMLHRFGLLNKAAEMRNRVPAEPVESRAVSKVPSGLKGNLCTEW